MKPNLVTSTKKLNLSKVVSEEYTLFQLKLTHFPATSFASAEYTIELLNKDGEPVFHFHNHGYYCPLTEERLADLSATLGPKIKISAPTPEECFLKLCRQISHQQLLHFFKTKNNKFKIEKVDEQPEWVFDVSVEWCYEQFGQQPPVLEEPPPIVSSVLRRHFR